MLFAFHRYVLYIERKRSHERSCVLIRVRIDHILGQQMTAEHMLLIPMVTITRVEVERFDGTNGRFV